MFLKNIKIKKYAIIDLSALLTDVRTPAACPAVPHPHPHSSLRFGARREARLETESCSRWAVMISWAVRPLSRHPVGPPFQCVCSSASFLFLYFSKTFFT